MAVFVPDYYKDFRCIAGGCRHNCCIGWEIDIDKDTLDYYKSVSGDFGKRLKSGMQAECGSVHFILDEKERCPFLNKDNLCDIILNLGEDKLCHICTEHPRFVNFYDTAEEKGLGICCEEAAKLILTRKEKMKLVCVGNTEENELSEDEKLFFERRKKIFDILQDREVDIESRIDKMLKTTQTKFVDRSYKEWKEIYLKLENLEPEWQTELNNLDDTEIFKTLDAGWDICFEQLLVYFIYRHLADSLYFGDYSLRISFALLGYKIIKRLFLKRIAKRGKTELSDLLEICRMYSAEIEYSEENTEKLLEILED